MTQPLIADFPPSPRRGLRNHINVGDISSKKLRARAQDGSVCCSNGEFHTIPTRFAHPVRTNLTQVYELSCRASSACTWSCEPKHPYPVKKFPREWGCLRPAQAFRISSMPYPSRALPRHCLLQDEHDRDAGKTHQRHVTEVVHVGPEQRLALHLTADQRIRPLHRVHWPIALRLQVLLQGVYLVLHCHAA